jgi:predicted acyltransferase
MATAFPATTSDPALPKTGSGRLLSLDVFRGATILAMILVNNPGEWGEKSQYWPLDHAEWHGWTPTDLIFPFFLFIVGTSLAYSLRRYRNGAQVDASVYWRIIRRTATLIFLGWMPTLLLKTIAATHGDSFDLSNLRIFGVLVRIAIVYFFTSLIVLNIPLRGQVALGIVLLFGYWATLAFLPDRHDYWKNLSNGGNIVSRFDRATIGEPHMYTFDRKSQTLEEPTEPEGFLSTFPAIVSALLGYWTGLFIQRRGVNYRTVFLLAACGLAIALTGQFWHHAFPINKKLWTSSFVLLTGGLAMAVLAACLTVFDIRGWRRLARPFEIVGVNAIFVFVCSGLLAIALGRNHVTWPPIDLKVMQSLWDAKESQSRSRIQQNQVNSKFTEEETNAALDRLTNRGWLDDKKESGVDFFTPTIQPAQTNLTYHGWLYRTLFTSRIHDPKLASLGMALLTVAFWWFICWLMSLFGLAIRV